MLYWSAKVWDAWEFFSTRKDATAPGSRILGGLYSGRRPVEPSSKNSRRTLREGALSLQWLGLGLGLVDVLHTIRRHCRTRR